MHSKAIYTSATTDDQPNVAGKDNNVSSVAQDVYVAVGGHVKVGSALKHS